MAPQARSVFVRPHDGLKEGGAGEQTHCPPRHRMTGGDIPRGAHPCGLGHAGRLTFLPRARLATLIAFMLTLSQGLGILTSPQVALAAQTLKFENGGTAQLNDDGTITGTCYCTAVWSGLSTSYLLTMPDGQTIAAHCIDFGLVDPADDYYAFTATPVGDGTYYVACHSNYAEYYQIPSNPRVPAAGSAVQRVNSDGPWRPAIVTGGLARVTKVSATPTLTDSLDTYSLAGAKFSVWLDRACTQSAGDTVLTTDDEGKTPAVELEAGTYWLREDTAPTGFALDATPQQFVVEEGKTTKIEVEDAPQCQVPSVVVQKVDASGGSGQPLAGAEFIVRYYDGTYHSSNLPSNPTRSWVLRSDDDGNVPLTSAAKVRGDAFYLNKSHQPVFPLGTITIQETKAPDGYYLEGQTASSPNDYEAPVHVLSITAETTYAAPKVPDVAMRAGIAVQKQDDQNGSASQGDASLAGIKFDIINRNDTNVLVNFHTYRPGETIGSPLITDELGQASTANNYLPLGTYEVRESATNDSYRNTSSSQTVTLALANANTIVTVSNPFKDKVVRGGVRVTKLDAELGRDEAQGDATLAGAEFSITLESSKPVVVDGQTYSKGQTVMSIRTDASGVAQTGRTDLPYGTYTIRETQSPEGYNTNTSFRHTFNIREEGVVVDLAPYPVEESVVRGGVRLGKVDNDLKTAEAQGNATLEGAQFSIYLASEHPVVVDGIEHAAGDVVKVISTDWNGRAATGARDLPYGTYRIRETAAPEGYLVNEDFEREFCVRNDGEVSELGDDACPDNVMRGALAVGKVSRETSSHVAQGEATLGGAQLSVTNASAQPVVVDGNVYDPGAVVQILTTDEYGYARTDDRLLPYGTYTIREVEPPTGYLPNEDWSATAYITEDGQTYDLSDETSSVDDQVMRGGFSFNKVDESSMERMGHTAFRITSTTTGESHVVLTDENGLFSTETNPHSRHTNANDDAAGSEDLLVEELVTDDAGVWFSGRTDVQTTPNDELGALPYDIYEVSELRSDANEGKTLVTFTVRIHQHDYFADMGTVDDKDTPDDPSISTTLTFDETQHVAPATERLTLVDVVRYDNLVVGQTYEIRGELMDQGTGEVLTDAQGRAVTATQTFVARASSDQESITFEFDASSLAGTTTVAFEHLVHDGTEVATHAQIDDEAQTVRIPHIATTLASADGDKEVSSMTERVELVDTVRYANLDPGRTYVVRGTLMDRITGLALTDETGREMTTTTSFVPAERDGTVEVPFSLVAETVRGKTLVAFERLTRQDVVLASHEDLSDEGQTVTLPSIATELHDEDGNHTVAFADTIELVDTVSYANLTPGATYQMHATLMDKQSGEALRDGEGNVIECSTTFLAERETGTTEVRFVVDGSLVAGSHIVAFETLVRNDREICAHASIDDASQTVGIPRIGTTLTGNGAAHEVVATEAVALTDIVSYSGLQAGATYVLDARLMDAQTGEAVTDANGAEVVSSARFEAESTSGTAEVPFELDARELRGKTVVCFETLRTDSDDGGRVLATHEDLADEGQSVSFPLISTHATDAEDGDSYIMGSGTVRVRDDVTYTNLHPGTAYLMSGTLHDAQTGATLTNADGTPVASQVTFTPETADGTVSLEFSFDASIVQGTRVVAFESCLRDDVEVATHADITDEDQTLYVARIRTTAKDKSSGTHEVEATSNVTIVDTVSYEGLQPKFAYELTGTLYDKQTGEPLKDAKGKEVTARATFTPKEASGTTDVSFSFDASELGGRTLVAFERLTQQDRAVATHEDIGDEGQSVLVKKPETRTPGSSSSSGTSSATSDKSSGAGRSSTPKTADALLSPVAISCAGGCAIVVGTILTRNRRR